MLNPFKRLRKRQQQPAKLRSQSDYDDLVRALATQANQGAKWEQILATIQARGLTPEQVAQWMTKYGGGWVQQPEPEFGQELLRLSEIAEGSLAKIVKTLGQAITQGSSARSISVKAPATLEPANSAAGPQNSERSSTEPDLTVLAEIEAYLRGDFSFADPSDTWTSRQSSSAGTSPHQPKTLSTASDWLVQCNTLYTLGRYEEALASCDQAISLQPDLAAAWFSRGALLHNNLERYEEALVSHEQAITLEPYGAKAWFNRSNTLHTLGCYEEALASCDQAISLQPDLATAWTNRGRALERLGRYEEALDSCDQAISLESDAAVNWENRGSTLKKLGRYEEALASFAQAISLQPDYALAWLNRGSTLYVLGRYEEVLASCDQTISLQPHEALAWLNRGVAVSWLAYYRPEDESLFRLNIQQELESRSRCALTSFFNRDVDAMRAHILKSLGQSKTRLLQTFADTNNPQLLALIQRPPSPELRSVIAAPSSAELQFLVNQPVLPDWTVGSSLSGDRSLRKADMG